MEIVLTLVLGGAVGWMAGRLESGAGRRAVLAQALAGVVGGRLGLWLAGLAGLPIAGDPVRWLVTVLGAAALVGLARPLLTRPPALPGPPAAP